VGATATRCHQCGASVKFSFAAANKALARFLPTESPVTYGILGLSCILYVFSLLWTVRLGAGGMTGGGGIFGFDIGVVNGSVLGVLGASGGLVDNIAQPWRYVMAVFLHASLLHIGFNMWVLMDVGPIVERLYGSGRTLFIYVATGVCGYVLTSIFNSGAVGGSGALLGLVGVLLAMSLGYKSAGMQVLRSSLVRWLIYVAIISFLPGISLLAHLGGFLGGFALGKIMKDRPPQSVGEHKMATVLGWGTAIVVLICLVMAVKEYLQVPGAS
jgi:rhomboid protease GluP